MINQPGNTINFCKLYFSSLLFCFIFFSFKIIFVFLILVNELEGVKMDTNTNQVLPPNPMSNLGFILKSPFGQAGLQYTQTLIFR